MLLSDAHWFADAEAYTIDNSCRFNDNDSPYTSVASWGTTGDGHTWTVSMWVKRGNLGIDTRMFGVINSATSYQVNIYFTTGDQLEFWTRYPGSSITSVQLKTTQVFRDTAAWYHFVFFYDDTPSTPGSGDIGMYVNGVQVTAFATETYASQNRDTNMFLSGEKHMIGASPEVPASFFDGYIAEFVAIDGTKLAASSFGETNTTTGQWVPKDVSGLTFGDEGWYLDFAVAPGTGNGAGTDVSGNANHFTDSGLAANDQMPDTPTDNFCTLNSIDKATQVTFADGNLQYGLSANVYTAVRGTMGLTSGKWYWELTAVSGMGVNTLYAGIATNASALQVSSAPTDGTAYVFISYTGNKAYTTNVSYGSAWNTNGKVIGVALDLDAGKIWWSIDDTWQASGDPAAGSNEAYSSITGEWFPYIVFNDFGPNVLFNFGQSAFSGTQPSGFNAISTANLDDPTIADPSAYFQTTLYTGTGSSLAVNQDGNSTFEPDFVWIKNRDATDAHILTDSVRGVTKVINSNIGNLETTDADTLTAFDSDGFTVGADVKVNTSTEKYVAWQWIEGSTPGFDVVTYTGTGVAHTEAHSLTATPDMMLVKRRTTDFMSWAVYHSANTSAPETDFLGLDATDATQDLIGMWNDTAPDGDFFTVGTNPRTNTDSEDYVAYLWAEVEGFSKFGKYTGNGNSDGPFVYCGFKPAFVMVKAVSATGIWVMQDSVRAPYNVVDVMLSANQTNAETTGYSWDQLSNGFKPRSADSNVNGSGVTYVFIAFAETPFKTANAR